jgi:hypothetical protein
MHEPLDVIISGLDLVQNQGGVAPHTQTSGSLYYRISLIYDFLIGLRLDFALPNSLPRHKILAAN